LAIMSVLPNMEVFSPVDAIETAKVVRYMASAKGPMYLRVNRNELPLISNPDEEFVPGKVYTIKEGKDAVVFATGVMVSKALEAAEQLEKEGISLKVVNVPSIKPIDAEGVCAICEDFEAIVTAEEHSVIGGLGATIARAINSKLARKIQQVGIQDVFGTSGQNYDVLLEAYGLTSGAICEAVKKAMK
jgi:transketolase